MTQDLMLLLSYSNNREAQKLKFTYIVISRNLFEKSEDYISESSSLWASEKQPLYLYLELNGLQFHWPESTPAANSPCGTMDKTLYILLRRRLEVRGVILGVVP